MKRSTVRVPTPDDMFKAGARIARTGSPDPVKSVDALDRYVAKLDPASRESCRAGYWAERAKDPRRPVDGALGEAALQTGVLDAVRAAGLYPWAYAEVCGCVVFPHQMRLALETAYLAGRRDGRYTNH